MPTMCLVHRWDRRIKEGPRPIRNQSAMFNELVDRNQLGNWLVLSFLSFLCAFVFTLLSLHIALLNYVSPWKQQLSLPPTLIYLVRHEGCYTMCPSGTPIPGPHCSQSLFSAPIPSPYPDYPFLFKHSCFCNSPPEVTHSLPLTIVDKQVTPYGLVVNK